MQTQITKQFFLRRILKNTAILFFQLCYESRYNHPFEMNLFFFRGMHSVANFQCLVGLIIIAVCLIPIPSQGQHSKVAEDINIVFTYSHGFAYESWSNEEAKAIFNRMTSTPGAYVAEIDSRFVFPDDTDLIAYPEHSQKYNWEGLLSLLDLFGRMPGGVRDEVVATLIRIHAEVAEDINYLKDKLVNNPPSDPSDLQEAFGAATFLYRKTLRTAESMNEPALLQHALERYDAEIFDNQRVIESYSLTVTGAFPPPDTLKTNGKQEP